MQKPIPLNDGDFGILQTLWNSPPIPPANIKTIPITIQGRQFNIYSLFKKEVMSLGTRLNHLD